MVTNIYNDDNLALVIFVFVGRNEILIYARLSA